MKNKMNADSTQRRGGAETQKDAVPPRPEEQSTGGNGGKGEKISVSSSRSTRAEGASMKRLSEKQITQKRHALFENFADFAMGHLSDDPGLACKAAETALKALSTGEHDQASHSPGDGTSKTPALSKFTEDLERAYGAE
jgi:hypothetical protein